MTFRAHETFVFADDSGQTRTVESDERFYAPSEIRWLLHSLGFVEIAIHGCHLGGWSRDHQLTPDDHEMLVIARKSAV
jgi:mannose-6-phosphate isomerase-like protein (cupin superfamily)